MNPGEIIPHKSAVPINQGQDRITIAVTNTSDHAVQVTSHYHFFEANKRLRFNRAESYGKRLDVPSGAAVRWQPGETRDVTLIDMAGKRRVYGFQGLVNGRLTREQRGEALCIAQARGFLDQEASP